MRPDDHSYDEFDEPIEYDYSGSDRDICPYCGGTMCYSGADDGGGDYGNSICDIYVCEDCDWSEERGCIEMEIDDDE